MATPRYRVIGFLGGNFGLAVAARNTLRALKASGREVDEIVVEPMVKPASASDAHPHSTAESASRDTINLFQMNPLDIGRYSAQWRDQVDLTARNICVPFWELPLVPRDWEPILGTMDLVLAPTRYIAETCAKVVGAERVLHYPQAVFLPEGIQPDRARWGIERGVTTFIVSFDIGSDIERKNPWAALDAFSLAFPEDRDVRLIVKTKPWPHMRSYAAQAERLAARIAHDDRMQLIDESLSYSDVLCLYASCDVMLSLHRSEGLGLHLMEAMSLGVVVIGTGWSGNLDFMTAENSVLVPFELVPVTTAHSAYLSEVGRTGQVWADADVSAAAEGLVELHGNPDRRRAMSATAVADMVQQRASVLGGGVFEALESALAKPGRPATDDFESALSKAHAAVRMQRLRDKWIAVQRRLGLRG
jgi:glycosyltransferase involved in cell wall biosynthesis